MGISGLENRGVVYSARVRFFYSPPKINHETINLLSVRSRILDCACYMARMVGIGLIEK